MVDYTNPTTQGAKVDTHGSQYVVNADAAGNLIGDQLLAATYWLQVVTPNSGPSAPGTASAYASLAAGIYNATPPTLTNGQQSALQLTSSGQLIVASQSTNDTNWGVVGANTLRTAAEIGNATGAANFNYGAINAQSLQVAAQLGNATGAIDYNFGAADAQTIRVAALIGNATGAASFNYGAVSAQTLQVAAQLGNATGAIDYNFGAADAQTIRVAALLGNAAGVIDYNYGAVGAQSVRVAAQLGNATGALDYNNGATDAQTLRTAANLAVAGANVSSTNPVPVYITSSSPGTLVNYYQTSVNVAAGASVNLTYTIPAGKTFTASKFWASGSGKIRVDVEASPDGTTYSTYWTGFNSTATPNISIDLFEPAEFQDSGTGSTIRIVITNRDLAAFDVFATITGTYQ
ncbi:unnamed protein product [Sphagnum jensenii]|uniref:Uncharacterized protein n=1 Tax=Sphagnum jensenii TaxID=128206 RepID=A0ABP0V5N2_9BRYO